MMLRLERCDPTVERQMAAEMLAAAVGPTPGRAIQERLARILIDDRELLISLECQLEQIHREIRLLNDERAPHGLGGHAVRIRH
jgi:hypothetical protein